MSLRQYRILVVDDEPDILESVARTIRAGFANVDVETAPDGPSALARLARGPIDIILTDYRMPAMDGLEFLRQAKKAVPRALRIMMTAYPDLDLALKALHAEGVTRFLVKPIDPVAFLEAIREALDEVAAREVRDKLISGSFGAGRVA